MEDGENTDNQENAADEIMLRPEYIKKLSGEDGNTGIQLLSRAAKADELAAIFRKNSWIERIFQEDVPSNMSISPIFSIKQVVDKHGRTRFVPFFGIKGSF